jgi:ferrous iron transport protein A
MAGFYEPHRAAPTGAALGCKRFSFVSNWLCLSEVLDDMSLVSLAILEKRARGVVSEVREDALALGDEAGSTVARRLLELGFVPGETVEVVENIWPGSDPLAVRVGNTMFALRRREAAAVLVEVDD